MKTIKSYVACAFATVTVDANIPSGNDPVGSVAIAVAHDGNSNFAQHIWNPQGAFFWKEKWKIWHGYDGKTRLSQQGNNCSKWEWMKIRKVDSLLR